MESYGKESVGSFYFPFLIFLKTHRQILYVYCFTKKKRFVEYHNFFTINVYGTVQCYLSVNTVPNILKIEC
jgi:hypothetical protein